AAEADRTRGKVTRGRHQAARAARSGGSNQPANPSPQRTNSLFCNSHASVAFQRSRVFGGKLHFTAMLPSPRDSTRSSGRSVAEEIVARVALPKVTRE